MVTKLVGEYKIPGALVLAILGTAFSIHQWADVTFITKAQAKANIQSLSTQVDENGKLISELSNRMDLGEVRQALTNVRDQQWALQVTTDRDGETQLSKQRKHELSSRLRDLERQQRCLTENRNNCK